jgi:hypothetical protein
MERYLLKMNKKAEMPVEESIENATPIEEDIVDSGQKTLF